LNKFHADMVERGAWKGPLPEGDSSGMLKFAVAILDTYVKYPLPLEVSCYCHLSLITLVYVSVDRECVHTLCFVCRPRFRTTTVRWVNWCLGSSLFSVTSAKRISQCRRRRLCSRAEQRAHHIHCSCNQVIEHVHTNRNKSLIAHHNTNHTINIDFARAIVHLFQKCLFNCSRNRQVE